MFVAQLEEYVAGVMAGGVPASAKIRQAVERHVADIKRLGSEGFPYVLDRDAVNHICQFVESLPHVEGPAAARGENIQLLPWQVFLMGSLNGWRHVTTGARRFRTCYVEVPRKNGKSTLLAGLGLYFLSVDGEPGAKVYSAASATHQARIVFEIARAMAQTAVVDGKPLAELIGLTIEQHRIKTQDPAAVFQPIAAQTKSQDGKNPHLAIVDELHEHEKRDVWDALASAMGAREQPLLIAITTAGWNVGGICYEQRRYLSSVLSGHRDDDRYFGLIYEADEGDEPGDEATWFKANPSLGSAKSIEYLRSEWGRAEASPQAMGEFLRKHLDIWTSVGASAFDLEAWDGCADPVLDLTAYEGRPAFIGVDLATREDFSSVVLAIPDGDNVIVRAWHFLPERVVERPGNDHFWGWRRQGWIISTPGAELDLRAVEALVLQLAGIPVDGWQFDVPAFDLQMVCYDAMFAAQMAASWSEAGLVTVEVRSRAANLNEPFNKALALVDDRRLVHDGDPVLRWMAANTLKKQVAGGDYIYPARLSPHDKIDGVVALCTALWGVIRVDGPVEMPAEPQLLAMEEIVL